MSQYPSSPAYLEGQSRASAALQRAAPDPEPPPEVPLNAPGLAVVAPNTSGLSRLEQLQASLGITGQVADTAGRLYAQRVEDANKKADDLRREQTAVDVGRARIDASETLSGLRREIAAGKVGPVTGQTAEEFGQEYTDLLLEGDFSEPYKATFRSMVQPAIVESAYSRLDSLKASSREETIQTIISSAAGTKDESRINTGFTQILKSYPELDATELREKYVLPLMDYAAEVGDAEAFAAAERNLHGLFPVEREQLRQRLQVNQGRIRRQQQEADEARVYNLVREGRPFETVMASIDELSKTADASRTDAFRSNVIARYQKKNESELRAAILAGDLTPEQVHGRVLEASKLSIDDPRYLDPATGRTLLEQMRQRTRDTIAEQQVENVLLGGDALLTEGIHSNSLFKAVGPDGRGFISTTNKITDPNGVGSSILAARILPRDLGDTILASLNSSNARDVTAAAETIGLISEDPRLYTKLIDQASPQDRAAIDEARESYERGRLLDQQEAATVAQRIVDRRAAVVVEPDVSKRVKEELKLAAIDVDSELTSALESLRDRQPQAKDIGIFGFDWLDLDPSISRPNLNVVDRYRSWFAERYGELVNVPENKRLELAREFAQAKLENGVDLVRWNGGVRPVLIDEGAGLRLPENLRWGSGFEDEAIKDLEVAGFNADDILTMRPYLAPLSRPGEDPASRIGWLFVTDDGDDLVNDKGELVIFHPTDAAITAANRARAILAGAEARRRAITRPRLRQKLQATQQQHIDYGRRIVPPIGESK